MTHDPDRPLIDGLGALLDSERAALLGGDLDEIGRLLPQKEALLAELAAKTPGRPADIPQLREKAMRNQGLLDGALEGIRAVAGRMAAVRRIRRNLETYDRNGKKSEVPGLARHGTEKRA